MKVGVFKLDTRFVGNKRAAGERRDIAKHFLATIAKAGRLDRYAVERTAKLVYNEGGKRLGLDIVGNNKKFKSGRYDFFEQGKDFLNIGNLVIGDKNDGVVQNGFHLFGIGAHVRGSVAAIELHALGKRKVRRHGLGFLDGNNSVAAYLFHSLADKRADRFVGCGYGRDLLDSGFSVNGLAYGFKMLDCGSRCFFDAFAHDHRVCARRNVFEPLANDSLSE